MKRSLIFRAALAVAAAVGVAGAAHAQKTINLTIGSSHPTTIHWVNAMANYFQPEVTKRAAAKGHKIVWREAYGGQLFKVNATLSSVQQGLTDISLVFTTNEASRMPLAQFAVVAPFTTEEVGIILDTVNEMNETLPALKAEWDRANTVYVGAWGVDTYHLFTKFPVAKLDDLKGRKLSIPGAAGLWVKAIGAVHVDGALPSYYTDIQTGVSEGTLSISTGILPAKVYEVAPYITTVNLGSLYAGAIAMNKDTFNALPKEVQQIVKEVGKEYSRELGKLLMERYKSALKQMVEVGAKQSTPVRITPLPEVDRKRWVDAMPSLARDWVKQNEARGQGAAAKQVLSAYMEGLRKRGVKPLRDWDKGL